jgi:hypothetical protein
MIGNFLVFLALIMVFCGWYFHQKNKAYEDAKIFILSGIFIILLAILFK